MQCPPVSGGGAAGLLCCCYGKGNLHVFSILFFFCCTSAQTASFCLRGVRAEREMLRLSDKTSRPLSVMATAGCRPKNVWLKGLFGAAWRCLDVRPAGWRMYLMGENLASVLGCRVRFQRAPGAKAIVAPLGGMKASRSGWRHLCGHPVWLVDESALTFFPPTPASLQQLREGVGWPRPLPPPSSPGRDPGRVQKLFFS